MDEEIVLMRRLDGTDEPKDLPLALLQKITNQFSTERKIGQGGFGAVYKGELGNVIVAVKRIYVNLDKLDIDDKLFDREFNSLWKINHQNVVRFLGFCSNTYQKAIEGAGSAEMILANVRERLFCFEYICGGSLDKYITDELRGLEWEKRYEIITGICNGLCYLHKGKNIVHMDLKPENILLNDLLVPKITDFGLSRPNTNSHTKAQPIGTRGYIAPEYMEDSKTTPACDIYSLGLIIIELITGNKEVPHKHNVLRRWRHRWNNPPTPLQYQQVTGCIDIAVRCRKQDPKARPSINEIIELLSESTDGHTGHKISTYLDDDMLGIEPLQLHFTSEINREISLSVKLTNKTKASYAFKIKRPSKQYTIRPDKGIVLPECNEYIVQITLQPQKDAPQVIENAKNFVVQSRTVSNGHRVEDITKHFFHEEAGKVVDNVNLMVVYEPKKPLKNSKSREETNMPAEEVPEAKKRKIGMSASEKGKNKLGSSDKSDATSMDLNSSAKGPNIGQPEQYYLHTLQSFSRHYPTDMTYLFQASDRAVDLTRGAMGSLLDKLGKLVTQDYNLEMSIMRDIEFFSQDLMIMYRDLPKLQNVYGANNLVNKVRELSYNIEDMVDSFLVQVESDSSRSGFRELTEKGLKLWENGMMTHHQIGEVITDIKNQVQAMIKMKDRYSFNDAVANAGTKATIDPRISGTYMDREQLIGIEEKINEIVRLFEEDGDVSKLKIVSIVGLGGLGKTTLAKAVYDKLAVHDQTKALIPVGQNPALKIVLKNIIIGCTSRKYDVARLEYFDEQQLIDELRNLLKDKRYFIVIDDLWDCVLWDKINSAFPRDDCGSRVVTTTRIQEVVDRERWNVENKVYWMKPLSDEDSRTLFFTRTFGPGKDCPTGKEEISKHILKKCGGMPLGINSIARHLARDATDSTWEYARRSLDSIKGNDIERMKQILDLSYIHLPDHLKTCLLHVCMYPEDREIDKNDLLMQWVAEGFVITEGGQEAEDVAEAYFKALIDMFMIQPGKIDYYSNEVLSCRVHDIILELMRSKSSKENFIHVIDGLKPVTGQIRRVSVLHNDKEDSRILETIKGPLSHARSVLLYRMSLLPDFLTYQYVRVLHLEDMAYNNILDLTGINRLFLLRYLKIALRGWSYTTLMLPDQIGELQQLETMDLQRCELKNYPSDIVSLPWLSQLIYVPDGIALPDGVDRLKSLRTLVGVSVYKSSVDSINGLSKLTNLRRLQLCPDLHVIHPRDFRMGRMAALQSSIRELSASLRILSTGIGWIDMLHVQNWSGSSIFPQVSNIRELDLGFYSFQRCPEWISQLNGLYKLTIMVREVANAVTIVASLPSLAYFSLHTNGFTEIKETVAIPGGGAFRALKKLIFRCPKASLTFEEATMPNLEKLEIWFRFHLARRFLPVGIEHLPAGTLKKIRLCMDSDDGPVKGSELWNYDDWDAYYVSEECISKNADHERRFKSILSRAFKLRHPAAHIMIYFEDNYSYDDETYDSSDYASVDEEDDCCSCDSSDVNVEDYCWISSDANEENEDGEDDNKEDDKEEDEVVYLVNGSTTSVQVQASTIHVELGESDSTEPIANFSVDINNDLVAEQSNNGMLVNAVRQYLDLNEAPR